MQCAVCSVQCAVCSVPFAVCSVQCEVCSAVLDKYLDIPIYSNIFRQIYTLV